MFVDHVYYWGDIHLKNLGEERAEAISPAKSAFEQGLCVNFSSGLSGCPSGYAAYSLVRSKPGDKGGKDPWRGRTGRCLRGTESRDDQRGLCLFEEDKKGSITEGKLADLVILDRNPLKTPVSETEDIKVTETLKEGRLCTGNARCSWLSRCCFS